MRLSSPGTGWRGGFAAGVATAALSLWIGSVLAQPGVPDDSAGPTAEAAAAGAAATGPDTAPAVDTAAAQGAAEAVVAELHAALVEAATLVEREARIELLRPVVRDTHDLRFIAELTIRRQWRDLDATAREAFVNVFETLSVATYATRFAGVGPETFLVTGSRATDNGRIEVRAEVMRAQGGNVPLDYLLQRGDGGWRIVNIVADGVSDLALKRARYQQVFRDGGTIEDLIALLAAETEAL
jgi:phospholipid transport system substrate-binding protein